MRCHREVADPSHARARRFLLPAGRGDLVLVENGLATADMGSTTRATKVACISLTASSIEMPQPSLRISMPKMRAAHMAPISFAPESVMSNGSTWSEYQGVASCLFCVAFTSALSRASMVEPIDGPDERTTDELNTAPPLVTSL